MNTSTPPWNQVAFITPSSCQTVRKRAQSRASRHSAQFSISSRISRRSAASSLMGLVSVLSSGRLIASSRRREAMPRLEGRSAIVTGGARGIGRHYSLALAAEGAHIMIADISDCTELAQEIAAKHGANSVTSAIADVSNESSVKSLIAAAIERFGRIDALVH